MSPSESAVHLEDLRKSFGRVHALNGLDLDLPAGQVTGFLGPNGAGKSTTLRILLGLLRADGGQVRVLGGDPRRDAVALHRRLAYVPSEVALWPNLTGGEALDILTRLSGPVDRSRLDGLIERFQLDPRRKARTYSTGNRKKVALVAALATDAELLLLDEPTSGLDPLMEEAFTQSVREAVDRGATVLLSSHLFDEVEKLADRVTIIRNGVTVEAGALADLRHLTRTAVSVTLDGDADGLARVPDVHDLSGEGGRYRFFVDDTDLPEVLGRLATLEIASLTATPPTLEDLFMRHYGDRVAPMDGARR